MKRPTDALGRAAGAAYAAGFSIRATDPRLRAVLTETLAAPGGLTRLKLGMLAGDAFGLPAGTARPLATAFEYFHTASLLFDDLPSMDDAGERRGRPCAHRRHGEAAAILGALAFVNRAYALTWQALASAPEPVRARAAAQVERCLGEAGVLDGQALDLHFASSDRTPRAVARAALGKTVSLLRLALVTPGILAAAAPEELRLLDRLAVYWGLAYQVADDCGDVAPGGLAGKTGGRDALLGRPNFALAAGPVATIHRLGRLLVLTSRTLDRLVALRPAWSRLRPLVTHLACGTAAGADRADAALQCA